MCSDSPNSLCCRGSGGVSSVLGNVRLPIFTPGGLEFLCAGAVNGDGHDALVYAEVLTYSHDGFDTFLLKDPSAAPEAKGSLHEPPW